jgi:hypothetical protein
MTDEICGIFSQVVDEDNAALNQAVLKGFLESARLLSDDDHNGAKRLEERLRDPRISSAEKLGIQKGVERFQDLQRQVLPTEAVLINSQNAA